MYVAIDLEKNRSCVIIPSLFPNFRHLIKSCLWMDAMRGIEGILCLQLICCSSVSIINDDIIPCVGGQR